MIQKIIIDYDYDKELEKEFFIVEYDEKKVFTSEEKMFEYIKEILNIERGNIS